MMDVELFPDIADGDTDDVSWSLETGRSMWQQGDTQEALRWLKRAAESASEAGNDDRSLTLAMAAAELRSKLDDLASEPAPPGVSSDDEEATVVAAPASTPQPQARALPPPAPHRPQSALPRPLSRPAPPMGAGSEGSAPPAFTSAPPSKPTSNAPPPLAPPNAPPVTRSTAPRPLDHHDAVRVAIQTLPDRPGFYVVRPLTIGERPAKGIRQALLVALDDEPVLPD
jgi:hypothetical protein